MKPSERIKDIADGYVANYPEAIMIFLDEQAELLETHTVKEEECDCNGMHEGNCPDPRFERKEEPKQVSSMNRIDTGDWSLNSSCEMNRDRIIANAVNEIIDFLETHTVKEECCGSCSMGSPCANYECPCHQTGRKMVR